jgi:protein regulator of cytokinesis 1
MKDLFIPPDPAETPRHRFEFTNSDRSESIVRSIRPEDPYDDRSFTSLSQTMRPSLLPAFAATPSLSSNSSRHLSQASSMQSSSENWETFSEQSDDAPENDVNFQHSRSSQTKRYTADSGHAAAPRAIQGKKIRGMRNVDGPSSLMMVQDSSEAGWTDDGETY